ncbi:hypothetical protein [uncultured Thiodictyon sp.]|jgi:hypothetical protein|uniref:hypothetical protein n=1 Tax=uncultured Thiodictyon sp. TaxID=1846217 RepID=UPI0025CE0533|nr:hypothetical protein [uncultured Thiodictyon sp.]
MSSACAPPTTCAIPPPDAELENRVLRLKDELAQLRERQERHQRRLGWGLGGVFATLLLAASFAAIEARGEASSVFTELTRILKEQGVDPALAYVAAKRVGILDQVRAR